MTGFQPEDPSIRWDNTDAATLVAGYRILFATSSTYEAYLFALQCKTDDLCWLGGAATTPQEAIDLIDENSAHKAICLISDSIDGNCGSSIADHAKKINSGSRSILIVNDIAKLLGLADTKAFDALCSASTTGRGGLYQCLEAVFNQEAQYIDPLVQSALDELAAYKRTALNQRERDILHLLSQGMTNKQISQKTFLAETTVRDYVSSILTKLGVANRSGATAWAIKHGLA